MFRRLEAPQSLRDSSPKWEQAHPQALWSAQKLYRTAKASLMRGWQARQGLTEGVRTQITPSAALRATAPPSGSKRTRKLCGLPGNFAVMPRALPLGELASPTGLD